MKNTGLTITIIVSVLTLLGGSYYMMWKKVETKIPTEKTEAIEVKTTKEDSTTENEAAPTPSGSKKDVGTNVDIDTELKNLDTEMGTAFQKDSDSDPTVEIQ